MCKECIKKQCDLDLMKIIYEIQQGINKLALNTSDITEDLKSLKQEVRSIKDCLDQTK